MTVRKTRVAVASRLYTRSAHGPYGRETQAIALFEPERNMLTTDTTARIMTEIVTGQCVTAARRAHCAAR